MLRRSPPCEDQGEECTRRREPPAQRFSSGNELEMFGRNREASTAEPRNGKGLEVRQVTEGLSGSGRVSVRQYE